MELKLTVPEKKKLVEEDLNPLEIEYLLVGELDNCDLS